MDSPSNPSSSSNSDGVVSAVTGQLWYNSLVGILMIVASAIALGLRLLSLLRGEWARRQEVKLAAQQEADALAASSDEIAPSPTPSNGSRQRRRFPSLRRQKAEPVSEVVEVTQEVNVSEEAATPPATRRFRPRLPSWSFRRQKTEPATEMVEPVSEVVEATQEMATTEEAVPPPAARRFRPRLPSWSFRRQKAEAVSEAAEVTEEVEEPAASVAPQGFRHRLTQALEQGRGRWRRGGATS